jgi:hypothetical protein
MVVHNDDTPDFELEIGKAAAVHVDDKEFVYLEKMSDGKWRLTFTSSTIPDFSKIAGFRVIRDEDMMLHSMEVKDGGLNMKLSGDAAMTFLQMLIQIFEQNGGKNFLTMTVERDTDTRYGIEIRNLNGEMSAAEKLKMLEEENEQLKKQLAVATSLGELTVGANHDKDDYPGISVFLNKRPVAWVEVDEHAEGGPSLQVLHWKRHFDENEEAQKHIVDMTPLEDESDAQK